MLPLHQISEWDQKKKNLISVTEAWMVGIRWAVWNILETFWDFFFNAQPPPWFNQSGTKHKKHSLSCTSACWLKRSDWFELIGRTQQLKRSLFSTVVSRKASRYAQHIEDHKVVHPSVRQEQETAPFNCAPNFIFSLHDYRYYYPDKSNEAMISLLRHAGFTKLLIAPLGKKNLCKMGFPHKAFLFHFIESRHNYNNQLIIIVALGVCFGGILFRNL